MEKYRLQKQQFLSASVYLTIQLLSLISPYVMGLVIDEYIPGKNIRGIVWGISLFVSIPFVSVALQTLYNYFLIKYIRKKGNEMAIDIMTNLVYQNSRFFDRENSLELLSYSSKEAVSYIQFYICDMAKLYVYISVSTIIFAILLLSSPLIALLQLLYFPLAYFPVKRITKNVDQQVQEIIKTNAQISQIKGDIFKAISFVKLSCLEEKKIQEVEVQNGRANTIWGRVSALDTISGIWSSGFVTVLFTGLSFGLGAILVLDPAFDFQVGQLVSTVTYTGLLYGHINTLLQTTVNKQKQEAEFKKIFSYLKLQGEREENAGKAPMVFRHKIRFQNCSFQYNADTAALCGLTVDFQKGQWTGIIGKSGSGKSTVLDLIMKLYTVKKGQLYIDDADIHNISAFDIRKNISKVTQDVYLFPGTIESNLRLMNDKLSEEEIQEALHFACLDEYVASLPNGLQTDVGEAGKLMSGGEKQRLSLAMGLLRKNRILLLDEVTANLDTATESRIAANLKRLVDQGYTIISVSHKPEFLKYADVIYTMEDGKLLT